MALFRTCSEYKPKEQKIHTQPEDYIIVNGQQYRVRRSSFDDTKFGTDKVKIEMLLRALEEANKTIEQQCLEIVRKDNEIKLLEQKLSLFEKEESVSLKSKKKNRLQEAIMSTRDTGKNNQTENNENNENSDQTNKDDQDYHDVKVVEGNDSLFDSPKHPPAISFPPQPPPVAISPSLFIVHDNPQLGKIISTTIESPSPSNCSSSSALDGTNSMSIMIETKDKSGHTCIILGTILSSSTTEIIHSNHQNQQQTQQIQQTQTQSTISNSRGDHCIVCSNLRGFRFLLNDIETRTQSKTIDIHLHSTQHSQTSFIQFENNKQLNDFFSQCFSRVDIIFSPSHENDWYPYWEAPEPSEQSTAAPLQIGMRKLAPQFRSNGVGYLRLGNDMSNFGTDFLSCDAMMSFISNYQLNSEKAVDGSKERSEEDQSSNNLTGLILDLSQSTKWTDRCNNLKRINAWFKITSDCSQCSETTETFHLLINALVREASQHNLQVLKESLTCLEEFLKFSRQFSLHILEPIEQIKELFRNIFKLLRHANRTVVDASTSLLKVWFENDSDDNSSILKVSHGSLLLQMVASMFGELYHRVVGDIQLRWFNEILLTTGHRWCQFILRSVSKEIFNEVIREEIVNQIQNGIPVLLQHKDEKIREASITLLGYVLALDILWSKFASLSTSSTSSKEELTAEFLSIEISSAEFSSIDSLLVSSSSKQFLNTITTEAIWQRINSKVLVAINGYLNRLKSSL